MLIIQHYFNIVVPCIVHKLIYITNSTCIKV